MSLADKFNVPQSLHDYILSVMKEQTEYQAKVKALMAKKGIKSLNDLSPDEKKKFFSQLDAMHQAKNEEVQVTESHFKVGDEVVCKASGMEGEVIEVDPKGEGKYYTVKREDGKTMKYAPNELKLEDEDEDEKEDEKDKEDVEEAKDAGATKEKETEFHKKLDKLVHKTFGKRPEEMKEADGGGTSIKGSEADRAKATAERAKLTMQAAMLRIKQSKERQALSKKKQAIKSEFDPIEESFSDSQIARMKAEYSKINTIDPSGENYKKLISMLDKLDKPTLEKLAGAGIKFVSGLAKNRVTRMSMKKEELQITEEVAGWIAMYNGQKFEIKKDQAKDLYDAKLKAIAHFKVPKSKQGLLAIKAAYNEEVNLDEAKKPVSKDDVVKLLIKYGNNPESAKKMVDKEFAFATKSYPDATASKVAQIIRSVAEQTELDESKSGTGYDLYHKDFSTAVQHAWKQAEKRGFQVDKDDWDRKVAMGPRKPGEGKTNSYSITLMDKNGKPVKKALQMQVYNKGGQNPYELNMYIEDVNVNMNKIFFEAMKKDKKEATAKDKNKTVKSGDKLSGKHEPVDIDPELKEETK
jgi:preprotein translocase subunit YajC